MGEKANMPMNSDAVLRLLSIRQAVMRSEARTTCFRVGCTAVILALLGLLGCATLWTSADESAIEARKGQFKRLQTNLDLPLGQRIQKMPMSLLDDTRAFDQSIGIENAKNYVARIPTDIELALINKYIGLLPPTHQQIFEKKLLAIYLIDNFFGGGFTDWVIDNEGQTFYYVVLNSALFTKSMDDWLTFKDDALFGDSSGSPSIQVKTQTEYKALMYGLLHEGAHIVDYELGVTPYMDALHRRLSKRNRERSVFTDGIWLGQNQPASDFDFRHRTNLNIYRIFPKKELIPRAELPAMYAQLKATPFVSFYSGMTWNEHLADYLVYHHIENKLGGALTITLMNEGKVIDRYAPLGTSQAQQLKGSMHAFYK